MTTTLYANNAKTTLAAPINATQTSITVAAGTGGPFPSPAIGQAFKLTLTNASVSTVNEICVCTARSGDVLTVIRGQEGTTALPFILGDIVGNYDTAASMAELVQATQLQNQYYQYGTAAGTANALTTTIPSSLTSVPDGMYMTVKAAQANTGPATLNVTLGSTIIGVYPIIKGNNVALAANDIPGLGYPIQLNWSSYYGAYVMQNPATGILVSAVPTGAVVQFPATSAPSGYLLCNGQLVSRTTYSGLWTFAQASGNLAASDAAWQAGKFSPGDGSTTFRLPQYGGYFLRSLDNGNGIDSGRAIGTVQAGQNVSHTHVASVDDPGHLHYANVLVTSGASNSFGASGGTTLVGPVAVNSAVTGISVSNATSGGTETRPINVSILTCIKY